MEDPKDLRDQAQRWRQQARFHEPAAAEALIEAARALERKADRLDDDAPSPTHTIDDRTRLTGR